MAHQSLTQVSWEQLVNFERKNDLNVNKKWFGDFVCFVVWEAVFGRQSCTTKNGKKKNEHQSMLKNYKSYIVQKKKRPWL